MSLATKSHLMTASHSGGNDEARSILGTPHSHEPTTHDSYTSRTPYDEVILNELPDVDDQCALEKGMTVDIKETKSQEFDVEPPALPERSALRTSRLLDSLKINSIESARRSLTTSHDTYLSSEEDASSIADDISDYDFDSGSESNADESEQSPAPRKSREASARAVSVIYVGKPCIVNLTHSRSSSSTSDLSESSSRAASTHERSPLAPTGFSNATRQDSSSTVASEKSKPAFLDTDPFANRHYAMDTAREQQQQQPQPPRDPRSSILSSRVTRIDGEHGISKLEKDGRIDCSYCWTIKRDVFDIPMLIVMNVSQVPIMDDAHHKQLMLDILLT